MRLPRFPITHVFHVSKNWNKGHFSVSRPYATNALRMEGGAGSTGSIWVGPWPDRRLGGAGTRHTNDKHDTDNDFKRQLRVQPGDQTNKIVNKKTKMVEYLN